VERRSGFSPHGTALFGRNRSHRIVAALIIFLVVKKAHACVWLQKNAQCFFVAELLLLIRAKKARDGLEFYKQIEIFQEKKVQGILFWQGILQK